MNRRDSLFDSIKGIAILGIMIVHLAQWNFRLEEGSILYLICSSGALGVELTFLVNGFFLARHYYYDVNLKTWKYIVSQFLRVIPVYWGGLLCFLISEIVSEEGCKSSTLNILSHFFFFNGVVPKWWNGFMGGTGYFGIIAIMWILFPIFMYKVVESRVAYVRTIVIIVFSHFFMNMIYFVDRLVVEADNAEVVNSWAWYLNRGFLGCGLGISLFFFVKDNCPLKISRLKKKVVVYCLIAFLALSILTSNSSSDGLWFSVVWCIIIAFAEGEKIIFIDNPIFEFMGKNITELFVLHIVLYYIVIENMKLINVGPIAFIIIMTMSSILAPILRRYISEPFRRMVYERMGDKNS